MRTAQLKTALVIALIIVWAALIIAKHFWSDIDTGGLIASISSGITGLCVDLIHTRKIAVQTEEVKPS